MHAHVHEEVVGDGGEIAYLEQHLGDGRVHVSHAADHPEVERREGSVAAEGLYETALDPKESDACA
jgi:hypothetical protein